MQTIEMMLLLVAMVVSLIAYGKVQYSRGYLDAMQEAIDILNEKLEELRNDD